VVPVVVLVVRVVLGVWPAALAGGVATTVGVLYGLAAWDRRARPVASGPRAEVVEVGPRAGGVHVEFARGLSGLADWYLSECEREKQR
jgi:hypothetical protein